MCVCVGEFVSGWGEWNFDGVKRIKLEVLDGMNGWQRLRCGNGEQEQLLQQRGLHHLVGPVDQQEWRFNLE